MVNEKRLIDANALLGEIERIYTEHYEKSAYKFIHDFFRAMIRRVKIAPTVDAVEVVRCKDCVNWYPYNNGGSNRCPYCGYPEETDFCSEAKRRTK